MSIGIVGEEQRCRHSWEPVGTGSPEGMQNWRKKFQAQGPYKFSLSVFLVFRVSRGHYWVLFPKLISMILVFLLQHQQNKNQWLFRAEKKEHVSGSSIIFTEAHSFPTLPPTQKLHHSLHHAYS